jgi:hypothetical protein
MADKLRGHLAWLSRSLKRMSEDVECHHDPGVLVWYGDRLGLVGTLENAFLQVVKTDSRTKKNQFLRFLQKGRTRLKEVSIVLRHVIECLDHSGLS